MHLFDPFLDHDYYFKLLLIKRSRTPNRMSRRRLMCSVGVKPTRVRVRAL
jgi:hypothetical protein